MSVNKYKEHILVLPEDDANRQIANGFLLDKDVDDRSIQILRPPGGWNKVLNSFTENHISAMNKFPKRIMLLLVDFDQDKDRLVKVKKKIPDGLVDRVFVLGTYSNPENLRKDIANLNNYEDIGKALAQDCVKETDIIWGHTLLKHNKNELDRMIPFVKTFLFN